MLRTTARALALALDRVLPAIERRNCIPITGTARLRAESGVLTVSGTNLDMQIDAEATIEPVGPSAEIAIDPRVILRLCRSLPRLEIVELVKDGDSAMLSWNGGRVRVLGMPVSDWPEMALKADRVAGGRTEAGVGEALGRVARCISKEETRYYLNGVSVQHHDDAGFLVATDGHQLAAVPGGGSLTAITRDLPGPAIVPRDVVPLWLSMAAKGDVELTFHGATHCILRTEGLAIRSKLIDGAYPDWKRVVPAEIGRTVTVRKGVLLQAAHLASAGVHPNNRHGLLKAEGGRLQVQLKSIEFEAALDVGPTDHTFERGLSLKLLVNGLYCVRGADVTLGLETEDPTYAGPIVLMGSDAEPGEVHLVMPLRDYRAASFEAPARMEEAA